MLQSRRTFSSIPSRPAHLHMTNTLTRVSAGTRTGSIVWLASEFASAFSQNNFFARASRAVLLVRRTKTFSQKQQYAYVPGTCTVPGTVSVLPLNHEFPRRQGGCSLVSHSARTLHTCYSCSVLHLKSREADKLGIFVVLVISAASRSGISPRDQDWSRLGKQGAGNA